MKDPIVEEVRKHRKEHTQKFNGELSAICADLRRIQKSSGHSIVCFAPKKIKPTIQSGGTRRGPAASDLNSKVRKFLTKK
jgi:hypothetical protein